jgi:hypothetical protein
MQDHSQKMSDFCPLTSTTMQAETEMLCEEKELNTLNSFEYSMDRTFIQKIVLLLESRYKHFRENFGYLEQRLRFLEKVCQNDQYIIQENINKNIPYEMGDVDSLFYSLDKEMNIALLRKLYEDYLVILKEQEKENNTIIEEPPLLDIELERTQRIIINPNFDENNGEEEFMEDLDIFNINNLQLRRSLF